MVQAFQNISGKSYDCLSLKENCYIGTIFEFFKVKSNSTSVFYFTNDAHCNSESMRVSIYNE